MPVLYCMAKKMQGGNNFPLTISGNLGIIRTRHRSGCDTSLFHMSGHSKWSTIKRQKAVSDARKGKIFTKLAKAITVAAQKAGPDPSANFALRLALEKARTANMPNENIDRAIKKATGEDKAGKLEEILYEGYGPDGVALLIKTVSDNRNRTTSELRSMLTKAGGSLASTNSVAWQFDQKGVIRIAKEKLSGKNTEELQLAFIDAGADDVKDEPEGLTIITPRESLASIAEAIRTHGLIPDSQELEYQTTVTPPNPQAVMDLMEMLEEDEDVDTVYTNADI